MKRIKTFIFWIFLSLFSLTYHSKQQSNKLSHLKKLGILCFFFFKNLKVSWLSFNFSHNGPKNIYRFRISNFLLVPFKNNTRIFNNCNVIGKSSKSTHFPSVKERHQIPSIGNQDIKCCNLTRT